MLKKYLSILLSIALICTGFSAVYAAEETEAGEIIIASDDYETGYDSTNIGTYNGGLGWENAWSTNSGTYTQLAAANVDFRTDNSTKAIRFKDIKGPVFRRLSTPITMEGADGQYYFKFNISDANSSPNAGVDFGLGGTNVKAGYDWDSTFENVIPYVKIGDEKYSSAVSHSAGHAYNAEFQSYILSVELSTTERDTVKLKFVDDSGKIAPYEIEARGTITGSCEYLRLFHNNTDTTKSKSFRIDNIVISKDSDSLNALTALVKENLPGYSAVDVLDSMGETTTRDKLLGDYTNYGLAYENFRSSRYASGTYTNIDGGAGWKDTKWSYVYSGTSTGGKAEFNNEELLIYRGEFSRTLANSVDLGVDGEYFVKVTAKPNVVDTSTNYSKHDLKISLGDIVFGSKYDAASEAGYYPRFSTDGSATESVSDAAITTRSYYDYILHIISLAEGRDKIDFYVVKKDEPVTLEPVFSSEIESSEAIDTISLTDGDGYTWALSGVQVECFNENIKMPVFNLSDVRSSYTSYEEAITYIDSNLPECFAAEYLKKEADFAYPKFRMTSLQWDSGLSTDVYTDLSTDLSAEKNTLRAVAEYYNPDDENKLFCVVFAVYDGGKLIGAKIINKEAKAGMSEKAYIGYYSNETLPEYSSVSNLKAKLFTFNSRDALSPVADVQEAPNSAYK